MMISVHLFENTYAFLLFLLGAEPGLKILCLHFDTGLLFLS